MDNLKTDAHIADILKKLKDIEQKEAKDDKEQYEKEQDEQQQEVNLVEQSEPKDASSRNEIADAGFTDEAILPWFTDKDRDIDNIHYIKFDDAGNVSYSSIKSTTSTSTIAALKLTKDYACDVDYFKNKHFILYVKQLDSDYSISRSFVADSSNIEVEDTKIVSDDISVTESYKTEDLVKASTEDITKEVASCDTYYHYVVFTDLGIADFIARQQDISYPYENVDYNKWFEEVSNFAQIKNPKYVSNLDDVNYQCTSNKIGDYKYDIITMHRPGVITLDSVDNSDSSSQIHVKLKDEFSFLPLNRVLKCLKYYALTENRSRDDFKAFICKYFDIA